MSMQIRNALPSDRNTVLDFCKDTFSWGDYITGVWDSWISEGSLLVISENNTPVGICHSLILKESNQLWIEGIRIDKNYRRHGFAKKLVEASELAAHNNVNCSKMLIEVSNSPSLALAKKLSYKIESQWNFYSIQPERTTLHSKLKFAKYEPQIFDFMKQYGMYYVRSWRWILINLTNTSELFLQNKIVLMLTIFHQFFQNINKN